MKEFLTKNADTAIVEIKEKLYERLAHIRKVNECNTFLESFEMVMSGTTEEQFLSELLDIIERS